MSIIDNFKKWKEKNKKRNSLITLILMAVIFGVIYWDQNINAPKKGVTYKNPIDIISKWFNEGSRVEELSEKYSGVYEGTVPNEGYGSTEWEIMIWEFKYNDNNIYEANVKYRAYFMSAISGYGKMTIEFYDDSKAPPKICLYEKNGGNIIGGNPCFIDFSSKDKGGIIMPKNRYIIKKITNVKDWKHIPAD